MPVFIFVNIFQIFESKVFYFPDKYIETRSLKSINLAKSSRPHCQFYMIWLENCIFLQLIEEINTYVRVRIWNNNYPLHNIFSDVSLTMVGTVIKYLCATAQGK